jgi:ABC-type phosphate/phosphonate transport system substrate-binding protein
MPRLASLPMYDFPELTNAHDALWDFVAERLNDEGVSEVPALLDRTIAYDQTWTDPGLLLGQSCGLPIVDQLDGIVAVLGGFSVADGTPESTYRSKLVVHKDSTAHALSDLDWSTGVRAVINGWDSLSGCASLGAACAEALRHGFLPPDAAFASVEPTGGHVHSAAALADRSVDLACMDGHTLALLQRHRPESVAHIRVLAVGPMVPCLPLITALSADDELVQSLRSALSAAAVAESLVASRETLGITGFVTYGNERYELVRSLRDNAKTFFDRRPT